MDARDQLFTEMAHCLNGGTQLCYIINSSFNYTNEGQGVAALIQIDDKDMEAKYLSWLVSLGYKCTGSACISPLPWRSA